MEMINAVSELRKEIIYHQTCDLCGEEIRLTSEKDLLEIVQIPIDFYSADISRHTVTEKFSVCNACLTELKDYLNQKYDICVCDYGGVVVNQKEKE